MPNTRSIGRQGLDCQRMDVALHEIVDSRVNQFVTRDRGHAAKRFRHDPNSKMALAARRAGMAFVQMALVLDGQLRRREASLEPLAQPIGARGGGASPCDLLTSQKIWGSMKSIVAAG